MGKAICLPLFYKKEKKMIKRKLRTKIMPFILKHFWYVNEGKSEQLEEIFCTSDFVRFSQIEKIIMSDELPSGDIAELGVYKGRLTKLIAKACFYKDRRLFLFDTFEGFNEEDLKYENLDNVEDFSDTSAEKIIKICKEKGMQESKIKIKKGWFPNSLDKESNEAKYAFVSIDFDLYMPTKEALNIMYDKLAYGGWIAIHDYGNANYEGVKKAVDEFVNERNIKFKFELCDYCGTIFIKKV